MVEECLLKQYVRLMELFHVQIDLMIFSVIGWLFAVVSKSLTALHRGACDQYFLEMVAKIDFNFQKLIILKWRHYNKLSKLAAGLFQREFSVVVIKQLTIVCFKIQNSQKSVDNGQSILKDFQIREQV